MQTTPKSLRLHIGIFGRTNVGKSSFLNMVLGQNHAITSPIAGTTTDVVEKTMELLPIGPVVFLDTAGIDDVSELSARRIEKANKVYARADVIFLITEVAHWTDYEEAVVLKAKDENIPVIVVVNKIDLNSNSKGLFDLLPKYVTHMIGVSCVDENKRGEYISQIKKGLIDVCPDDFLTPPTLIGDLVKPSGINVLIVPIDLEAPKGRIILPQVQIIRDILDNDAASIVVKEHEYAHVLAMLKQKPDIVVCDSQVVLKMVADTPPDIKCTTFSILFARYKSDLNALTKGAAKIESLKSGDKVLIAESCSHHPIEDDIGRVKIPRWLNQFVGGELQIDTVAGRDFPENLSEYDLVVHCGGCMFNRREMLWRIEKARGSGVAITNYGLCISLIHGVLKRVLEPFPAALDVYVNNTPMQ